MSRKLHLAISSQDIAATIVDYSKRFGADPEVVVEGEYALWRTESLNVSVRQDPEVPSGQLGHLGWEDSEAQSFTAETDVNGIVWEHFNATHQKDEILEVWPEAEV
jgi:hypothetical protein